MMSQPDNTCLISAISLPDASGTVRLPVTALRALLDEIKRLGDLTQEHEMRLDKHSEYILDIRHKEMPIARPGRKQEARMNKLESLLIARGNEPLTFAEVGKYLELGCRNGKTSTRRQNMTLFGKYLADDNKRFHVFDSNTQKGARMVCLVTRYFAKGREV